MHDNMNEYMHARTAPASLHADRESELWRRGHMQSGAEATTTGHRCCNSKPPALSPDVIRNLCTSLCDVDESLVGDEALKKKRRTVTPVGDNMQSPEEVTSVAPASKKKIEKTSSGAPSKTKNHKANKNKPAPEDAGSADPDEA